MSLFKCMWNFFVAFSIIVEDTPCSMQGEVSTVPLHPVIVCSAESGHQIPCSWLMTFGSTHGIHD